VIVYVAAIPMHPTHIRPGLGHNIPGLTYNTVSYNLCYEIPKSTRYINFSGIVCMMVDKVLVWIKSTCWLVYKYKGDNKSEDFASETHPAPTSFPLLEYW